jgi:hypothetical protein
MKTNGHKAGSIPVPAVTVEIIQNLADGCVRKDIMAKHNMGFAELNHQLRGLMLFTGCHTSAALVAWGFRNGVVK